MGDGWLYGVEVGISFIGKVAYVRTKFKVCGGNSIGFDDASNTDSPRVVGGGWLYGVGVGISFIVKIACGLAKFKVCWGTQ